APSAVPHGGGCEARCGTARRRCPRPPRLRPRLAGRPRSVEEPAPAAAGRGPAAEAWRAVRRQAPGHPGEAPRAAQASQAAGGLRQRRPEGRLEDASGVPEPPEGRGLVLQDCRLLPRRLRLPTKGTRCSSRPSTRTSRRAPSVARRGSGGRCGGGREFWGPTTWRYQRLRCGSRTR
ncbi:unnamed protein product, partial [Prorocentrum cordatum]